MGKIFLSKKFQATLAAVAITIGAKWGLQLDTETIGLILSPFIAYIAGQAYVDGKVNTAIVAQNTATENNVAGIKIAAINNAYTETKSVEQILSAVSDKPQPTPSPSLEKINEKTMNL